eukprot:4507932-Amphidinium_carterae.3
MVTSNSFRQENDPINGQQITRKMRRKSLRMIPCHRLVRQRSPHPGQRQRQQGHWARGWVALQFTKNCASNCWFVGSSWITVAAHIAQADPSCLQGHARNLHWCRQSEPGSDNWSSRRVDAPRSTCTKWTQTCTHHLVRTPIDLDLTSHTSNLLGLQPTRDDPCTPATTMHPDGRRG